MVFFEQSASDYARRHVRLWVPVGCLMIAIGMGLWIGQVKYKAADLAWFPPAFTVAGCLTMAAECWLIVPMLKLPPSAVVRVTVNSERLKVECPSRYFGESFEVLFDDVAELVLAETSNELVSLDLKTGKTLLIPCASGLNLDRIQLGKHIQELHPEIHAHVH